MKKPNKNHKKLSLGPFISRFKKWRFRKKLAFLLFSFFLLLWIFLYVTSALYRNEKNGEPLEYGVSFSKKYADELRVDWQKALIALTEEAKFKHLRLMSHWDLHEPQRGQYDFSALDWQMDQAAKTDAKVMLAIGLRQPRWPECHTPEWAKLLDNEEKFDELYKYISAVVTRYKNHPALASYQLENEYFNRNFGECDDYSRSRLLYELELVKSLDTDHPVYISFADQLGFPFRGPSGDGFASSLYRGNFVPYIGYFPYPITSHYYSSKTFLVKLLHGEDVFIHELQLEPWGPRATRDLIDEEQKFFMPLAQIHSNLKFASKTGMSPIYLWGGEWWYWRKMQRNDRSQWDLVINFINNPDNATFPPN